MTFVINMRYETWETHKNVASILTPLRPQLLWTSSTPSPNVGRRPNKKSSSLSFMKKKEEKRGEGRRALREQVQLSKGIIWKKLQRSSFVILFAKRQKRDLTCREFETQLSWLIWAIRVIHRNITDGTNVEDEKINTLKYQGPFEILQQQRDFWDEWQVSGTYW